MTTPMGGTSLGQAVGRFVLDTSGVTGARQIIKSVSADISKALGGINIAAQKAEGGLSRLSGNVGKVRGELSAIGLASGLIAGLGLKTAGSLQEINIQLTGMTGSESKAVALMASLRAQAKAAGAPVGDMLQAAKQLLPSLEGNTKELEKWLPLVRRVATLNPREGIAGAAFGINEALSSGGTDLVSLAERFNISRTKLRASLAANGGDLAKALDEVLTKMGVTDATAAKLGKTFNASLRGATDAATQLLAAGFTPLLNALTPLLQKTADWLTQLQATQPAVAGVVAGLVTFTAAAAPALLLLNQMVTAAKTLKGLQLGASLAGLAGSLLPAAALAAAGGGLALGASRGLGAATGNEKLANTSFADLVRSVKVLEVYLNAGFNNAVKAATSQLGIFDRGLATAERQLAQLNAAAGGSFNSPSFGGGGTIGASGGVGRSAVSASLNSAGLTPAQSAAASDWAEATNRIEVDAYQARLVAVREFNAQMGAMQQQYQTGVLREEQDFARNRRRQSEQLARSITEMGSDSAKRAIEWQADLDEKIAERRADSAERVAEIEKEYAKNRERAAGDHRDNLMKAAANLDAVAVHEENRRFARQSAEAEESHNEQISKQAESLAEQIEQDQKAQRERLDDAKAADEERIEDMRASLAEAQRLEDEDRQTRKDRDAEDHAAQVAQMAADQAARLIEMDRQEAAALAVLNAAHQKELIALGMHNVAYETAQTNALNTSLTQWQEHWRLWNLTQQQAVNPRVGTLPGDAARGLSDLPSSSWVVPPNGMRSGGGFGPSGATTIPSSRTLNMAPGSIVINGAGRSAEEIGIIFDGRFRAWLNALQ